MLRSRDFGERTVVFFDERLNAFLEGRDVRVSNWLNSSALCEDDHG